MTKKYPFHYEVRVKLLAFDKKNNVRNESFIKKFDDKTPLENRANAFEEFNEYLSFLEQIGRLKKSNQGNFVITQPSFINEILDKKENSEDYFEFKKVYNQYKEEISVYLVVNDLDIAKNVIDAFEFEGKVETEFEIHRVSSSMYDLEPQNLIDSLEMQEVPLYEYYQINVGELKTTVYHYGLDYAESGEDEEGGAKRTILKTPYVWDTIERYNEIYDSNQDTEETDINEGIDLLSIIKRGESNQVEFKPCLLYNFKTQAAGIGVKYLIAKAICGFLNSNGGVLFIGVNDNGNIQGLENYDYSLFHGENEKDKLLLEFDSLLAYFFDLSIKPLVDLSIKKVEGKDILVIVITESYKPIFLKNKKNEFIEKELYIRMNASTRQIVNIEEMVEYVFNKQWKKPSR
ncbi:MAG TPA: ATP-binding protein [Bacteroidia bacterium]|nr:ATP-binding protein [Bacteroidia bacterium]QQR94879.1 MAG: ATP-binding protein [Bacteroidota bacterium]MBP7715339.1 ATP-binding protein [Bacteroidia bacterium]HOZ81522.1 ATP-binding protein [Bacteroidia bacterium]HOZ90135.1 ATP-binding protein [Bacteroidia bacterium]